MTWAENIKNDTDINSFFVRLSARLNTLGPVYANVTGNIYSISFTRGPVYAVSGLTLGASSTVATGEFFYDTLAQVLYVNDGGAVSGTNFVVTFYIFSASRDVLWYQTPDDATTPIVQWIGNIKSVPEYKVIVQPLQLGLIPVEPTTLTLVNDQTLNYVLFYGSFNRTACEVWHRSGNLAVENIEQTLSGVFGQQIQYADDGIIFQVLDKVINFDASLVPNYITATSVDPQFQTNPLMKIWGAPYNSAQYKPVFQMMNIDYNSDAPTTSNNRKFALVYDPDLRYEEAVIAGTINPGGGVHWVCTPKTSEAARFRQGDDVWFDGAVDQYFTVLSVSVVSGHITFTGAPTGSNLAGNLRTGFVKQLFLVKDGKTVYRLKYGRDYTYTLHASNQAGITLTSTAESNNSAATFDPSNDSLWCCPVGKRMYGLGRLTNAGNDVNDFDVLHDVEVYDFSFAKGVNILYAFLKDECGMTEAEIDFDSFTAAMLLSYWNGFLAVPFAQGNDVPTRREVLDLILTSMLLRAYYSPEGLFTLKAYQQNSTADAAVPREEMFEARHTIDYATMANVRLVPVWDAQSKNRIVASGTKDQILAGTAQVKLLQTAQVNQIGDADATALGTALHGITNSIVLQHIVADPNSPFFGRIRDLYSERSGTLQLKMPKQNADRNLGDVLDVTRPSLLGQEYDGDDKTQQYEILEITKSEAGVDVTLDDKRAANNPQDADWS